MIAQTVTIDQIVTRPTGVNIGSLPVRLAVQAPDPPNDMRGPGIRVAASIRVSGGIAV
jgi:hypothetical protein